MFISDDLVTQLKKKISMPDGRLDPQELMDFLYLALMGDVVPQLIQSREEFFVRDESQAIVSGTALYRLPSRAYGGLIRRIMYVNADGTRGSLERTDEGKIGDPLRTGSPTHFYIKSNKIGLYPIPDSSTSGCQLFISFWLQPSRIVPAAECAHIDSVASDTVTLTSIPSDWTDEDYIDIVKGTSDYEPHSLELSILNIDTAANTIQFTASVSSDIRRGDYLCLAGESPFPFLQSAYFPALLQYGVSATHESSGDEVKKLSSDNKGMALLGLVAKVAANRIQGSPKTFEGGQGLLD